MSITLKCILVMLVLSIFFAGCGQGNGGGAATGSSGTADGGASPAGEANVAGDDSFELVLYIETPQIPEAVFDHHFDDFTTATGNTVLTIRMPSDQWMSNLAVLISGGHTLDVMFMNGQDVRGLRARGLIQDMNDLVDFWDRFYEPAVYQYTFDGRRIAVPAGGANSSGVYYNRDILEQFGLEPPRNFDDLINMRNVLDGSGISVFGFGGATIYMWPMWYFNTLAQTSGNNAVDRTIEALRGQAQFTEPDFVEAMEILGTFGAENLFQVGVNGALQPQGQAVFSTGHSAMFFGGTWALTPFREAGMGDEVGMISFPIVVNNPGVFSEQTGSNASHGISLFHEIDGADRSTAALALIDYISSDEKVEERLLAGTGAMTSNINVIRQDVDPLINNVVIPELLPTTNMFLDWIWPPEVVTAFQHQIQAVVGGQTTAQEAMEYIQSVFDDLVAAGYDFDATE